MDPIPLTLLALCVGAIIGGLISAVLSASDHRLTEARYRTARRALRMIADGTEDPARLAAGAIGIIDGQAATHGR